MKEYYAERFRWIFNYTSKKFGYCLLKTLCLIFGVPIYAVAFVVEMVFTAINMIFCWIPILGVVVTVICKAMVWLFGMTFYINILTDLKAYNATRVIDYEVSDATDELIEVETDEQEVEEQQAEEPNVTEENK